MEKGIKVNGYEKLSQHFPCFNVPAHSLHTTLFRAY
jgi:hypothetical protein